MVSIDILMLLHEKKTRYIAFFQYIENASVGMYLFKAMKPLLCEVGYDVCKEGELCKEVSFFISGTAVAFRKIHEQEKNLYQNSPKKMRKTVDRMVKRMVRKHSSQLRLLHATRSSENLQAQQQAQTKTKFSFSEDRTQAQTQPSGGLMMRQDGQDRNNIVSISSEIELKTLPLVDSQDYFSSVDPEDAYETNTTAVSNQEHGADHLCRGLTAHHDQRESRRHGRLVDDFVSSGHSCSSRAYRTRGQSLEPAECR